MADDQTLQELEHEMSVLVRRIRRVIAERARSTDLDKQLGYALLTVGRLRGRLREAGINPDQLFGADLCADHDLGPSGPD